MSGNDLPFGKLLMLGSAFGHPLGCTGARQIVTALSELRRQDKRIAVTSMCVGTVSFIPLSNVTYSNQTFREWAWQVSLYQSIRPRRLDSGCNGFHEQSRSFDERVGSF